MLLHEVEALNIELGLLEHLALLDHEVVLGLEKNYKIQQERLEAEQEVVPKVVVLEQEKSYMIQQERHLEVEQEVVP